PPPSAPAADHVLMLAGSWTCRTFAGSTLHRIGRRDGDLLDVAGDVQTASGRPFTVDDRYTFDRGSRMWRVRLNAGSAAATEGTAPPWTDATWDIAVRGTQGLDERVHFELLADGTIRRSTAQPERASPGSWRPTSAELCAPGNVPPPADACVAENFPAFTIAMGTPPAPSVSWETHGGTVVVIVNLNAQSQIIGMHIQQTPAPALNDYVLQTVQLSRFQTEIRDCKPIATDYTFSLTMKPGKQP
ncbi:MAG TPA: hypothetical protein VFE70_08620, partial [Candidatus Elarobacter sp.]|nr:hypothetical protein [Candidatus Elarobacter sp.]